jgi:hypothetical protein
MVRRFRRGFTAAEKTELWDRWQRGESLKGIGRARTAQYLRPQHRQGAKRERSFPGVETDRDKRAGRRFNELRPTSAFPARTTPPA